MFSGPCGCCAGDAQLIHLERQAIAALEERVGRDPALADLLARCRAHNKAATVFATTSAMSAKLARDGFDMIALGTDMMQLRAGIKSTLDSHRNG